MIKVKATGSGERLDSDGALSDSAMTTLWGLPVVLNLAMTKGKALVGDWAQGATLFVRESDQCADQRCRPRRLHANRVTMLGEGRWGFAVWLRLLCDGLFELPGVVTSFFDKLADRPPDKAPKVTPA